MTMNRQESHRIYLQRLAPRNSAVSHASGGHRDSQELNSHPNNVGAPHQFSPLPFSSSSNSSGFCATSSPVNTNRTTSHPFTVTMSAAVRLTDKARAKDVTALLRGKFGFPPASRSSGNDLKHSPGENRHEKNNGSPLSSYTYSTRQGGDKTQRTPSRFSRHQKVSAGRRLFNHGHSRGSGANGVTGSAQKTSSPKEEPEEEVDALVIIGTIEGSPKGYLRFEHEEFREEQQRMEIFRRASAPVFAASQDVSSRKEVIAVKQCDHDLSLAFDMSSSTNSNSLGVAGGGECSPTGATAGTAMAVRKFARTNSCEPIHIVRTVLPDEHPLQIRDEMLGRMSKFQQKSEVEMGMHLERNEGEGKNVDQLRSSTTPKLIIRWYFQPCSPLGSTGTFHNVPACIDVEGYCTDGKSESDSDDDDGDDAEDINSEEEKESTPSLSAGKDHQSNSSNAYSQLKSQLIEERCRFTLIRDLSDPSLLSGCLLKQSGKDPNVWKRKYCVLSEDRLWVIGR